MHAAFVLALALHPQDASVPAVHPPSLERTDLDRWRAHLRPRADELRFASLDWAPTFLDGLRRASAEGRPLLLWAMNGHPLGST